MFILTSQKSKDRYSKLRSMCEGGLPPASNLLLISRVAGQPDGLSCGSVSFPESQSPSQAVHQLKRPHSQNRRGRQAAILFLGANRLGLKEQLIKFPKVNFKCNGEMQPSVLR
jgi:hypothetical protein